MKFNTVCFQGALCVCKTWRTGEESGECPVDPASDDDHGDDIGDISLHHIRHHAGI